MNARRTFGQTPAAFPARGGKKRKRSSADDSTWSVRVAKRATKCCGKTCCVMEISPGSLRFDKTTCVRNVRYPKIQTTCFDCFFKRKDFSRVPDDLEGFKSLPSSKLNYVRRGFSRYFKVEVDADEKAVAPPLLMVAPANSSPLPSIEHLYRVDSLRPFQKKGVEFCVANRRVLIADEMGLGKTVQAVKLLEHFKQKSLVVAPSAVRLNWADEILAWSNLKPVFLTKRSDSMDSIVEDFDVLVVSYGLFVNNSKAASSISKFAFETVVVDESHAIKTRDSARTKLLKPIVLKAKNAFLLSGTPALSRPLELFPQLTALRPDLFKGGFKAYAKRYCDPKPRFIPGRGQTIDYSGSSNLPELHSILSKFTLRRTKAQVLTQLPAKVRSKVRLDKVKKIAKVDFKAEIDKLNANKSSKESSTLDWYAQTALAKAKSVAEYVKEKIVSDDFPNQQPSVLIFAHHTAMLDSICEALESKTKTKSCFVRIDGSTSSKQRSERVKDFQSGRRVKFAVLSLTAAGVGITLTKATQVVFAELHWTPGILRQAEDRAHRIGQRECVNVSYLLAPNTADEHLWRSVEKKIDTVSQAMDGVRAKDGMEAADERVVGTMDAYLRPVSVGVASAEAPEIATHCQNDDVVDLTLDSPVRPRGDIRSFLSRTRAPK